MKIQKINTLIILQIILIKINCEYPYLFGTSLNTKGVSNGKGVGATETTAHALDDVAQSKSYAHGDNEVNARSDAQAIWTNKIHGVNSTADAVQNGKGDSLADSWSKSFTPTKDYYMKNYYSYIKFLNFLTKRKHNHHHNGVKNNPNQNMKNYLRNRIDQSIANYSNPGMNFNGETSFDLQQARGSGRNTSASTNSQTFNWGRNHTIQKGNGVSSADQGWATTNNANWALGRNNYVTTNKNSAAFGENASSKANSNLYINGGQIFNSGKAWGQALGKDSFSYSNLNGNTFGHSALNGGSNTYSNGERAVSVSEIRGTPYAPNMHQHHH